MCTKVSLTYLVPWSEDTSNWKEKLLGWLIYCLKVSFHYFSQRKLLGKYWQGVLNIPNPPHRNRNKSHEWWIWLLLYEHDLWIYLKKRLRKTIQLSSLLDNTNRMYSRNNDITFDRKMKLTVILDIDHICKVYLQYVWQICFE